MTSDSFQRPTSLREALQCMAATPGARLIAGGTDLVVQSRKSKPAVVTPLISLRSVTELLGIDTLEGGGLRIGAATPLTDVGEHPVVQECYPALVESIQVLGSRQIRNVATLGGNLCNGSPAADTAPALLVLGARVELTDGADRRELGLEDFLLGPGQTALRPGELLSAVILDPPAAGARMAFLRKGRVKMDLAIVSLAVLLEMQGNTCARILLAAGAVAPVPLRLTAAEQILCGSDLGTEVLGRAAEAARAAVEPISDLRSGAEYRRHLVGVYLRRGVRAAAGQKGGDS